MSKPSETLVVVNSANRNISVYPEPNDFVLDLKQRFEVQLISLGFLQLPYSQFLVEHEWDSFFFDVGLSFPLQTARTLYFRTPSGESRELVCLPAPFTQVVYVGRTSEGLSLWRVDPRVGPVAAHGLSQGSLGVVPAKITYDPSKPPLQVFKAPTPSELLTPQAPDDVTPGYTAALVCAAAGVRTFCGPEHLCRALNAFMGDASVQLPLRFSYNAAEMTLALQPQVLSEGSVVLEARDASLLSTLHFPCLRGTLPIQPMLSTRFPAAIERRVPIGNYDYPSMRQQVEILVNPMGQFSTIPTSKIFVNFFGENELPTFKEVTISGATFYDPKAVALWVSTQLALAGGKLASIRLDFLEDTFVIFSKIPFKIAWGDSKLGLQLGFDAELKLDVFHRGTPRFYCQTPSRVQLAQVYGGESCQHMKTLVFQSSGRLQSYKSDGPVVQASSSGGLSIPVGIVPCEYLVALPCPGRGFCWTVSSLTQAGLMPEAPAPLPQWTTLLSPLVPEDLSGLCTTQQRIVPCPVFNGAVNLYFPTPPGSMQPRMAEILGFEPGAALWPVDVALNSFGPSPALKAPYHVTLEGPFYVLVELGLEHMSATITHRTGNDVKSRYFAVIALFSNFKLERYYKAEQATTGVNVVNSFHVRITNPWGATYQFHGKNWSAALNFVHVQKAIRTECP